MSRVSVDTDLLDGLADSISNKFDESVPLTITEMTGVVNDILVRTGSNVTVSGATVSIPSGLYKANVSKTVASGTEGVPTASKGTVSNHSISVTPSVTNSAGYISGSTKTGTAVTVSAGELVSGNKSITDNGSGIDVTNYATVSVNVQSGEVINNQSKTVTPTESQQVVSYDVGYTGLSDVTVEAIDSEYVGSDITRRSDSDMTFGFYGGLMPYIGAPAGYYAADSRKMITRGTEGTPTAAKGTVSNHSISVTPSVTNSEGYIMGSTKTGSAITVTASELASGNKAITSNGTNIDVVGYSTVSVDVGPLVNNQTKTATPSEAQKVITYDNGYTGLEQVTISAISSTYVGSGITRRSSSDMTFGFYGGSMPYIGAPAGYYASDSMKMIPRGTEGTPVATKGTISNHSIDITPSVTNSDGYIIGSTKTGTAVTVTAAELASGTKSITSNGTGIDVVGYSTVDVAVPAQAINNQNKTVTPTTSVQTVTADTGYTGLGTVTVNAMPGGTLGTLTWTRLPSPIISPTALRIRAQATELRGFVPGYFDSFDVYTELAYETKTVTPSTSQQTVSPTNTSKYMNQVIVNPIPSQYIVPTGNIDITSSGTTIVTNYDTATVSAMTLPTAPTTTYTGAKVGSNIGHSTSTRYLNIPAGYNDTAKYYQISAVSNMTLPTTTSVTATGTSKAVVSPGAANKYINIPVGYNTAASYYTITPGMIYEEGTWTPTADVAKGSISFASSHSSAPYLVHIFDQTQTTPSTNSISFMLYTDAYQMYGATVPYSTNFRYGFINAAFKTDSGGNVYMGTLRYPSTDTGSSSTAYPRFWVTESEFNPYSGSDSRYWRAGRTYKWIAVWKAQ